MSANSNCHAVKKEQVYVATMTCRKPHSLLSLMEFLICVNKTFFLFCRSLAKSLQLRRVHHGGARQSFLVKQQAHRPCNPKVRGSFPLYLSFLSFYAALEMFKAILTHLCLLLASFPLSHMKAARLAP